jgi:alternate signal-mediated exported protein, CPF_0494 family
MKNKKPIVALGALAVVGLIAGTIAYFTSEATFDNVFSTAIYKTKTTETFTAPDNWAPGQSIPKTIVTENQGTIPVAVRVGYTESWVDEDGDIIDPDTIAELKESLENDPKVLAIFDLDQDHIDEWTKDGSYYYYNRALAAADTTDPDNPVYDTTSSFLESVTLNPELPVDSDCTTVDSDDNSVHTTTCSTAIRTLGKATYTLTLVAETVQYDQYKQVWFADDADNDYANAVQISEN